MESIRRDYWRMDEYEVDFEYAYLSFFYAFAP